MRHSKEDPSAFVGSVWFDRRELGVEGVGHLERVRVAGIPESNLGVGLRF